MIDRLSFGFHNPNHAAALACALLPLCFGWRRAAWVGRGVAGGLFAVLLLTQSRTGLIVAALEWAAWWTMRRGKCGFQIPDLRSRMGFRGQGAVFGDRALAWLGKLAVVVLAVGLSLWRLGPRLALDGSILNRPKIWLAGLRLFAANPDGVGLGNSGALASAFLLPGDVPEVRTLVSSHLTLLAECGWLVGWAYLAFLALALCGVRRSPRVGLAFAGLALSACSSTVFDWPVLFGCASQGGLGGTNLALSWLTLALFAVFGARLIIKPTYPPAKQPEGAARRGAFNAENEEERRRGEASTDFTDSHGLWEGASANLHESSPVSIRDNPCQFVDRNSADGVSATLNTEVAENRRHGEVATDFTDSHGLRRRCLRRLTRRMRRSGGTEKHPRISRIHTDREMGYPRINMNRHKSKSVRIRVNPWTKLRQTRGLRRLTRRKRREKDTERGKMFSTGLTRLTGLKEKGQARQIL